MPPHHSPHPSIIEQDAVIQALLRPETYPHRPERVTHRQTRISRVFLTGPL